MVGLQDKSDSEGFYQESDDESSESINGMYYSTVHGIMWLPNDCHQTTLARFSSHSVIRKTSSPVNWHSVT